MSKTLLSFLLSELETVRLCCQSCTTVVELPLGELVKDRLTHCPSCHQDFNPLGKNPSPLAAFAAAAASLADLGKVLQVEFVLPVKE